MITELAWDWLTCLVKWLRSVIWQREKKAVRWRYSCFIFVIYIYLHIWKAEILKKKNRENNFVLWIPHLFQNAHVLLTTRKAVILFLAGIPGYLKWEHRGRYNRKLFSEIQNSTSLYAYCCDLLGIAIWLSGQERKVKFTSLPPRSGSP